MCVSIRVALWEVQHYNTVAGEHNCQNSENLLVKNATEVFEEEHYW